MTFETLIAASLYYPRLPRALHRPTVPLYHVDPFNHKLAFLRVKQGGLSPFPFVLAWLSPIRSFFLIFILEPSRTWPSCLQDLGRQGYYLHEFRSLSSLATGPKCPLGIVPLTHITAAFSSNLMYEPSRLLVRGRHPDHHGSHITLLDPSTRHSSLYGADNDITEVSVSPSRSTQYVHTHYLPSPRVVSHFQP